MNRKQIKSFKKLKLELKFWKLVKNISVFHSLWT